MVIVTTADARSNLWNKFSNCGNNLADVNKDVKYELVLKFETWLEATYGAYVDEEEGLCDSDEENEFKQ